MRGLVTAFRQCSSWPGTISDGRFERSLRSQQIRELRPLRSCWKAVTGHHSPKGWLATQGLRSNHGCGQPTDRSNFANQGIDKAMPFREVANCTEGVGNSPRVNTHRSQQDGIFQQAPNLLLADVMVCSFFGDEVLHCFGFHFDPFQDDADVFVGWRDQTRQKRCACRLSLKNGLWFTKS